VTLAVTGAVVFAVAEGVGLNAVVGPLVAVAGGVLEGLVGLTGVPGVAVWSGGEVGVAGCDWKSVSSWVAERATAPPESDQVRAAARMNRHKRVVAVRECARTIGRGLGKDLQAPALYHAGRRSPRQPQIEGFLRGVW